jgi:hypothetical protein
MGHETANWGGRGLVICYLMRICVSGSESRDVDSWTQTSVYAEDRGLPSTDDPGV